MINLNKNCDIGTLGKGVKKVIVHIFVLLILGILLLFKPKLLWKLENIFTVKGGEPTELYLAVMRISGTVFIIASIGFMIYLAIK